MNKYEKTIEKAVKDILVNAGFEYGGDLIFLREINEISQAIAFDFHREFKRVSFSFTMNRYQTYSYDDRNFDYFFQNDEEFYGILDKLKEDLIQYWIPLFNERPQEFIINRKMVNHYNQQEENIKEYLGVYKKMPEDIEEFIRNAKEYMEKNESEDREIKEKVICVLGSVYYQYIVTKYPEYERRGGGEGGAKGLCIHDKQIVINPLRIAYEVLETKDFKSFRTGMSIYNLNKDKKWYKIIDRKQLVY